MDDQRDDSEFRSLFKGRAAPSQPSEVFEHRLKEQFRQKTLSRRRKSRGGLRRVALVAATALVASIGLDLLLDPSDPIVGPNDPNGNRRITSYAGRALWADEAAPQDFSLTIFNDNLVMVRDQRLVSDIPTGRALLEFRGVCSQIVPQSVRFRSMTHPERVSVLEQNYHYDLASKASLLKDFIDSPVQYLSGGQWRQGVLLSFAGSLIVRGDDGIHVTADNTSVRVPEPMRGILTRPTLRWTLGNDVAGEHRAQIAYLSHGMSWAADHNILIDDSRQRLSLDSWISVTNSSGANFPNASLKFLAGDVNLIEPFTGDEHVLFDSVESIEADAENNLGVDEKAFSEYHLYTYNSRTDLPNNSVKQVKFADRSGILYSDAYQVNLLQSNGSTRGATHLVRFINDEDSGAGIPLPKGRVNVSFGSQSDHELIRRLHIDHTPKGEEVTLTLGRSLRVLSESTLTDATSSEHLEVNSWKVRLRNDHDRAAPVELLVPLARGRTHLVEVKGHDTTQERTNAFVETVKLTLKPGEEMSLRITVTVTK